MCELDKIIERIDWSQFDENATAWANKWAHAASNASDIWQAEYYANRALLGRQKFKAQCLANEFINNKRGKEISCGDVEGVLDPDTESRKILPDYLYESMYQEPISTTLIQKLVNLSSKSEDVKRVTAYMLYISGLEEVLPAEVYALWEDDFKKLDALDLSKKRLSLRIWSETWEVPEGSRNHKSIHAYAHQVLKKAMAPYKTKYGI